MNNRNNIKTKIPKVLKPHGTATWLLTHYPDLSTRQIAKFCEMDPLQIEFLRSEINDGKLYAMNNPIIIGHTSEESILKAIKDHNKDIEFLSDNSLNVIHRNRSKKKYISQFEKKNKLRGALWLINSYKKHFQIDPIDIKKITGATISNINRLMTNPKYASCFEPDDPVKLNLCKRDELEQILLKYFTNNKKNQ